MWTPSIGWLVAAGGSGTQAPPTLWPYTALESWHPFCSADGSEKKITGKTSSLLELIGPEISCITFVHIPLARAGLTALPPLTSAS